MSINVTGSTAITVNLLKTISGGTLSTPTDSGKFSFPATTWGNGTNAGSLEEIYFGTVAVAGTNGTTISLANTGGVGVTQLGAAVVFTKIKQAWFYNRSTNAADIVTIGGGSNAWEADRSAGATMILNPGMARGFADILSTGFTVTASTADKIKFVSASTNTVNVDIMIAGNKS